MFSSQRKMDAIREDVLCAFLVLRELNDFGQHYNEKARIEIVDKAIAALRNVWIDTGADPDQMEPQMRELLKAGEICRARPQSVAE